MPITHIPTGHADQVLCLQLHTDTLWAGLYPRMAADAPLLVAVAPRRSAIRHTPEEMQIAGDSIPFRAAQLRQALAWLRQHGVRTTEHTA